MPCLQRKVVTSTCWAYLCSIGSIINAFKSGATSSWCPLPATALPALRQVATRRFRWDIRMLRINAEEPKSKSGWIIERKNNRLATGQSSRKDRLRAPIFWLTLRHTWSTCSFHERFESIITPSIQVLSTNGIVVLPQVMLMGVTTDVFDDLG